MTNGGLCWLSTIALTGNSINLLNGKRGTTSGAPTSTIDGIIGPCTVFTTGTQFNRFTGPTTTPAQFTMATIFRPTAISNSPLFSTSTTGSTGYIFFLTASDIKVFDNQAVTIASGTTLTVGVPYFLLISYNGTAATFLWVRLDTGQVKTVTASGTLVPANGNGNFNISSDLGDTPAQNVATLAFFPQYLELSGMLQWAQDPWSFWYPRNILQNRPYDLMYKQQSHVNLLSTLPTPNLYLKPLVF